LVLGAEGDEQEAPGSDERVHPALQKDLAAAVDPVEILDQDDDRLPAALHQASHDADQLALPEFGVARGGRRLGVGQAPDGAGLADDAHDLAVSLAAASERRLEGPQVVGAPDETREAARP